MSRFSTMVLLCIITFLALNAVPAQAQTASKWSSGIDFTARAANREKSRWSLTDWLAMKERNKMMDQWLSLNAPSSYEFSFAGSYNSFKTEVSTSPGDSQSHTTYRGEASAYAQLVGVTAEYENNTEEGFNDLSGIFNLRLLGNSIQNTSLTVHYGLRTRQSSSETLRQQFGQASLQLYMTKFFGFEAKYRYYLPTSTDALGDINADTTEAGAFIDFKALRLFGTWFKENQKSKLPAASEETTTDRTGIRSGIKIFF